MRRASDLPRHRAATADLGPGVLIVIGVLFLLVIVFGRALARFYVDYLWHDALGRGDVFWGVIRAKFDAVRAVLRRLRRRSPGSTC